MEVLTYSRSMNPEDTIDWIGKMDKYFYIEKIEDPKKVKVSYVKLKGRDSLWWDNVQTE